MSVAQLLVDLGHRHAEKLGDLRQVIDRLLRIQDVIDRRNAAHPASVKARAVRPDLRPSHRELAPQTHTTMIRTPDPLVGALLDGPLPGRGPHRQRRDVDRLPRAWTKDRTGRSP